MPYVIRMLSPYPPVLVAPNRHWTTDTSHALSFEFQTTAIAHAVLELDMEPTAFELDPLPERTMR